MLPGPNNSSLLVCIRILCMHMYNIILIGMYVLWLSCAYIVLTVQWDKYIEQYICKGLSADFKQDLRMKISVWRCKWRFVRMKMSRI